jgi:uncharacterized membrane protein YkoI
MKRWIVSVCILALLLVAIGAGVAMATSNNGNKASAAQTSEATQQQSDQNNQEPAYQGSIKVPDQEPQDLTGLAKITADQAKEAALKANPGTSVNAVSLDNENGNLVWGVELNNGTDVKIDAGNGSVLSVELQDAGDSQEQKDGNESNEETLKEQEAEKDSGV